MRLAERGLFGNQNAIGKRVKDDKQSYEVVGVVRDLKEMGISKSVIYLPLTPRDFARPPAGGMTILVRSDAGPDALSAIRSEIASIDRNLTIFNVQTLSDYLDRSRSSTRFAAQRYGGMGVFGLVLAAIGLAGDHGLLGCTKAQGDRHPHGTGCKQGAGAAAGAARRRGAGLRRNYSRIFGRDGDGKNTFGVDQHFCAGA